MLAATLFMQRVVGNPIMELLGLREPEKGPPATFFLISISIIGFITGCFYAVAYISTGRKIAIRNHVLRAIVFGLFVYFSNYFAQSFGLMGAKGADVLMSFQWNHAIFDFFAYLITFMVCGVFFKTDEATVKSDVSKREAITVSIACAVVFPLLMFVSTQITALLLPAENMISALRVAPEAATTFYVIFYSCFILTGVLLPLLYIHTEYKSKSQNKYIKFACVYSFLIWIPVVFAMFAFGMNIVTIIIFSLESFAVIFITVSLADRILRKLSSPSARIV